MERRKKAGANRDVILSTKESSFRAWPEFFERFVKKQGNFSPLQASFRLAKVKNHWDA